MTSETHCSLVLVRIVIKFWTAHFQQRLIKQVTGVLVKCWTVIEFGGRLAAATAKGINNNQGNKLGKCSRMVVAPLGMR